MHVKFSTCRDEVLCVYCKPSHSEMLKHSMSPQLHSATDCVAAFDLIIVLVCKLYRNFRFFLINCVYWFFLLIVFTDFNITICFIISFSLTHKHSAVPSQNHLGNPALQHHLKSNILLYGGANIVKFSLC